MVSLELEIVNANQVINTYECSFAFAHELGKIQSNRMIYLRDYEFPIAGTDFVVYVTYRSNGKKLRYKFKDIKRRSIDKTQFKVYDVVNQSMQEI